MAHLMLQKHGYICAAHCRKASDFLVGLGGFKNMYPLVPKLINSNILELGRSKPGQIFSQYFKIMSTLISQEPQHMQYLKEKRNLTQLVKYALIQMGKA